MRGNLKIKRGLRDMYAQNTMCEPCLEPDSSKTNIKNNNKGENQSRKSKDWLDNWCY